MAKAGSRSYCVDLFLCRRHGYHTTTGTSSRIPEVTFACRDSFWYTRDSARQSTAWGVMQCSKQEHSKFNHYVSTTVPTSNTATTKTAPQQLCCVTNVPDISLNRNCIEESDVMLTIRCPLSFVCYIFITALFCRHCILRLIVFLASNNNTSSSLSCLGRFLNYTKGKSNGELVIVTKINPHHV